jgi:pyruvate formate lyase activating enzyme
MNNQHESWKGFKGDVRKNEINVRDFIMNNYVPYDGDDSFLVASTERTRKVWKRLTEINIPVWIRHVIVPGWTDDDLLLKKTADRLARCRCIEKVELLPYHTMGVRKYEQLGMEYRLANTFPLSPERLENARNIFRNAGLRVS